MKFTKIPESTFQKLQLNAGVLLKEFDTSSAEVADANIVGATTGGVNFAAVPTFKDFGEDIDNCPKNMKELKKLETWDITMGGTFVTVDTAVGKMLAAAADVEGDKIAPRNNLADEDFTDLWWVGDYSDENGETKGGYIAIHMMNTLSTGGFAIQSSDKAKGAFAFSFAAHYSITDQDTVPFEIYIKAGEAEA